MRKLILALLLSCFALSPMLSEAQITSPTGSKTVQVAKKHKKKKHKKRKHRKVRGRRHHVRRHRHHKAKPSTATAPATGVTPPGSGTAK